MEFSKTQQCLASFFERRLFHGAVLVVYQNKKLVFEQAFGFNDFENQKAMQLNQIFRAYSMTKLVTLIASFICLENQDFQLNDPITKFFPEFKTTKVLTSKDASTLEDLKTPLTIEHLLTMTSGFTYFGNKNLVQIQTGRLLQRLNQKNNQMNLQEFTQELAKIPLLFQPGTNWQYGVSFDVLGAIIEKTTGQSFRDFCQLKIFEPLKMPDTDFCLHDLSREALVYRWSFKDDQPVLEKDLNFHYLMSDIQKVPPAALGGSGLFTTAHDFAQFLNLFLDGCDLNGKRFLSQKNLDLIKTDHLGALRKNFVWTLNQDYSYGYGLRIRTENKNYPLTTVGECGWDGYLGSTAIIDDEYQTVACLMLSTAPGHNRIVESEFFAAFYEDLKLNKTRL